MTECELGPRQAEQISQQRRTLTTKTLIAARTVWLNKWGSHRKINDLSMCILITLDLVKYMNFGKCMIEVWSHVALIIISASSIFIINCLCWWKSTLFSTQCHTFIFHHDGFLYCCNLKDLLNNRLICWCVVHKLSIFSAEQSHMKRSLHWKHSFCT